MAAIEDTDRIPVLYISMTNELKKQNIKVYGYAICIFYLLQ